MCNYCSLIVGETTSQNGHVGNGRPVIVTYAFASAADLAGTGYTVADRKLKNAVDQAVRVIERQTGVEMVEVESSADEMISILYNDRTDGVSWAYYPSTTEGSPNTFSQLGMNKFYGNYAPGSGGFQVLLHEFGHTLGLKHPFEGSNRLSSELDNTNNTIMSYTWRGPNKREFQWLDIEALDELYGGAGALRGVNARWDARTDTLTVNGSQRNDQLLGVNDSNIINGRGGGDFISGRDSDDTLRGHSGSDVLRGFDGDDLVNGGNQNDRLRGGDGEDTLLGQNGNDQIRGEFGDDLSRGGRGNDTIIETWSNDTLFGEQGNDTLRGSGGNDRLVGGGGTDRMAGGPGADIFVLKRGSGNDQINDFRTWEGDRLDVRALNITRAEALSRLDQSGRDAKFDLGFYEVVLKNAGNQFFDGGDFIV